MEVLIPKSDSWYIKNPTVGTLSMARVLGPFHDSGDPWQRINIDAKHLQLFEQGKRLFTENSVHHRKVTGEIHVLPGFRNARPLGKFEIRNGAPLYELDFVNSSGRKTTIQTSLQFLMLGREAFSYMDGNIIRGRYEIRKDNTLMLGSASTDTKLIIQGKERNWQTSTWLYKVMRTTPVGCYGYSGPDSHGSAQHRVSKDPVPTLADGIAWAQQNFHSDFAMRDGTPLTYSEKLWLKEEDFSMSQIRDWINRYLHPDLFVDLPSLDLEDWGELCHQATKNLDALSANMIGFVKDLRNVKSLIPKLKELSKVKTHADNYLSFKYGVLPTISDLEDIWKAFSPTKYYDRGGLRRVSAYDTMNSVQNVFGYLAPVSMTRRLHIAVNDRDTGLDALVEKARNIGIFPSLTNIWDLVPYSFVLDWFIDVGSVLERIDTKHRLLNLDIPFVVKSEKIEYQFGLTDLPLGIGASLLVSDYSREVTKVVPQPRIFGEVGKPPTVQNHWIEGSALILQRTK